jgi:metal-responsive CopG/Arc/MetJ family transcriptional regulator
LHNTKGGVKMVQTRITMPKSMIDELDRIGEKVGETRTTLIRIACREYIKADKNTLLLKDSRATYTTEQSHEQAA